MSGQESASDAFNEATLKLELALGTLNTVTGYIDAMGDEGLQVSSNRGHAGDVYSAIYSAIHHLRDCENQLRKIPIMKAVQA